MTLSIPEIIPGETEWPVAADIINVGLVVTGPAADFTSENPVLALGQRGHETDTGREKVGDGVTAWTSLAYLEYADISGLDSSGAGALYLIALSALDAAARLGLLLALFEDGADDESEDAGNLRGLIAALTAQALGADGVTVVTDGDLVSLPYATSSGATNRSWGFDAAGNFWLPTYAETLTALASVVATVSVTGSGEQDVTVTAATTNIRIAPTGGNMTIDQVTGLYMGQAINVTLVQDSTDRTLALAGGSNAVLGHDDALDMPSGSGEVARGLLVGMDDGTGAIVPHFFAV